MREEWHAVWRTFFNIPRSLFVTTFVVPAVFFVASMLLIFSTFFYDVGLENEKTSGQAKTLMFSLWLVAMTSAILLSISVWVSLRLKRKRRQDASAAIALGRLYLQSGASNGILGGALLLLITVWSVNVGDFTSAKIAGAVLIVIALYYALTHFRVAQGFFGDNRVEAEELLHFVTSKADRGLPPGTTVSDPAASKRVKSLAAEEVIEGARA